MEKTHMIRDKGFYLRVVTLMLPVALQSLITMGVNLADNIMVGQLGDLQLSAATLANQFTNLYMILGMGIGGGAGVLTAQYFGMKDGRALKQTIALMFRIDLVVSVIFMTGTVLFPAQIMRIYTTNEDVIAYGVQYFYFLRTTFICHIFTLTVTQVLRSVKIVKVPLYASLASFFINIFFNWVFIFGNLGAPRMEIAGAAVGTMLARILEMIIIVGYLLFRDKVIGFRLKDILMPASARLSAYIRYSLPVIVSDCLLGLGNNALSVVMGHISAEFVAASSITVMTVQICSMLSMASATASTSMVGNAIGEGKREYVQRQGVTFLMISVVIGAAASILLLLLNSTIIGLYDVSAYTKELAEQMMDAVAIIVLFRCTGSMLTKGVLRAGGDTKFLMFGDIFFLWAVSIPLGSAAGLVWHLPVFWTYLILQSDNFFKTVLCAIRLFSGKWIQKIG